MRYNVAFGSSFSVDQFGFVGRGVVTTESDTVVFSGNKGWPWPAKLGVFVALTVVLFSLLRIAILEPFVALVLIHYFCTSKRSLSIQRASITNVQRDGRWIRFTGQHPESGKGKQTVFKVDTEQGAASLEATLSSRHSVIQQAQ
ncbi:MAG TPA: hypothetical protein VF173_36330 [Thermoanaerobaculia bacterium]|nr:hypothetical protein [Thermoanaerobaculia bacterium]